MAALNPIFKIEQDVVQAASHLNTNYTYRTGFPNHQLGNAFKAAAQVIASKAGVAVVKVSHNGFDTTAASRACTRGCSRRAC